MPHCTVEYTRNLDARGDIPGLLAKLAAKFRDSDGVFPIGAIRVRAIRLDEYVIADGAADDAFVHITVKIGEGRPAEFRKAFFDAFFDIAKDHLAPVFDERGTALSMYVEEVDEQGAYRHNTIHKRFGR
ncbi:5-carboxymethyl-2-hydroxymuconate Delta-isomerase [Caulobacter sp.]|uniref:5-carboxymethyl-2-hydroxymuconate Delta-isomerase n=1 Tax=Caulobacter sp. TaxID=78 RepID=UPI0031DCB1D9